MSDCWTRPAQIARRLRQPPDKAAVGVSKSVKPARPSVSARRDRPFRLRQGQGFESGVDYRTNRFARGKLGNLRNATDGGTLADGDCPTVWRYAAVQNRQ